MAILDTRAVLTVPDVVHLANVVHAAWNGQRVGWEANAWTDHATLMWGTARSIGDDRGNFASDGDDIRECYLRVTTSAGFEAFLPVREVVELARDGLFSFDYTPPAPAATAD